MLHIIAGAHRGRKLQTVAGKDIRPTTSRTRESLFNILTHRYTVDGTPLMQDARFADICCGSGAVGLEALSRGAAHVTFVDSSAEALRTAKRNADILQESAKCEFLAMDVTSLPASRLPYDVIFSDPPYDADFIATLLHNLYKGNWLHTDSLLVLEQRVRTQTATHPMLVLTDERKYGQSLLRLYEINA